MDVRTIDLITGVVGSLPFLAIAGYVLRPFVPYGGGLFSPYVAALDIGLVFTIFKGDVRLT